MSAESAAPSDSAPTSGIEALPDGPPPYSRPLPDESARHFALFTAWLAIPPVQRNLTTTHVRQALRITNGGRPPSASTLSQIARANRWLDRARAYDTDRAETAISARGDQATWEAVKAYRFRQQRIASASLEASVSMLNLVVQRLLTIKPEDLAVRDIPAYISSIAKLSEMASASEAESIGLSELVSHVEQLRERAQRLTQGGYGTAPPASA